MQFFACPSATFWASREIIWLVPTNFDPQFAGTGFRPGDSIAERYRVVSLLATGPYTNVFKATDLLTNEAVALKLIATVAARDNSIVSRYRMELNLFRQINHPGLVRIFDFGDYLGQMYLAMELIDGSTLRDRLRSGLKFSVDEFGRIFAELCDALRELHAQHVVHRNIHPGNVMLTRRGAKLMDFGIARDQNRSRDWDEAAYAAPEQLMGQPATPASDIYAIGVLSYEMLTGRRLERGKTAPLAIDSECEAAAPGIRALIETCVQVDPTKRFQNVQALRSAGDRIFASRESRAAQVPLEDFKTGPAPAPDDMAALFTRIVRTLINFHASGQEHAELAPGNIRVNGEGVEFKTSAAAISPSSGQATLLISDAKYTAPEVILARKTPDQAAHACGDVYVLGFVFYELLVGKDEMLRQFGEAEQMQTGLAWMRWHADPKSQVRPLAEAAPACPRGLADLIERMIQKDPSQRIGLQEVAETLDRLTVGLARTQPFVIGSQSRTRRRGRKALAATIISALILLALMVATGRLASRVSAPAAAVAHAWARITGRSTAQASADSPALPKILQTATGPVVLVPAGEFLMGSDPAQLNVAGHRVKVGAFYIDRLEVSNGEYLEFCARTGRPVPEPPSWDRSYFAKNEYPVVNVDRDAAASFCESAGKRLPSEQEWEKAAGGAEVSGVIWGNWTLPGLANLKVDGHERPAPVGSFAADVSPFDVLDAAGNVREWVAGDYNQKPGSAGSGDAPPEPALGVVRGGSFATPPAQLSPSWRAPMPLSGGSRDLSSVGFRCAVDAQAGLALSARQIASATPFRGRN